MGKLALAAKITHVPSMYLSRAPRPAPRQPRRRPSTATRRSAGAAASSASTRSWSSTRTGWSTPSYHVNCAPQLRGHVHQQRAAALHQQHGLRVPGQPGARPADRRDCHEHGVSSRAHERTTLDLEYGTLVPMRYMNADRHFKVVSVSALVHWHYLHDSARAWRGDAQGDRRRYDGTVAFLASGSLSHRFAQNGSPEDRCTRSGAPFFRQVDHAVVEMWQAGRLEDLLRDAARCTPQGARAKASCTTPRCCSAARLGPLRRQVEVVTAYFARPAPGRSTPLSVSEEVTR